MQGLGHVILLAAAPQGQEMATGGELAARAGYMYRPPLTAITCPVM